MQRLLVLAALVFASSGCGGAISSVYIIQGQLALAGARSANAETLAPYEFTSADAYLRKAREAHSYADFEHSLRFARLATVRAQQAKKKALDQNKPLELPPGDVPPGGPPSGAQPPPGQAGEPPPPPPVIQEAPVQPPVIIRKVPDPQSPSPQAPPRQ